MTVDLVSLAIIALIAAASPIVAKIVPNKLVPETVFLLIAGALLGPNVLGLIEVTDAVALLSDLGLGFLFLLAGYEINPKSLTGGQGKRGLVTWIASIALAFGVVIAAGLMKTNELEAMAVAIALTTTALGTLMPIMKERGLMGTRVGESILAYGTWGELCPVLAMALLLSTRAEWQTALILLAFVAIAVIAAVVPAKAKKAGHRLFRFLSENADGTSQTMMRMVVLLLVGLVAVSAVFDLDIVLGAFAAGFVLRYIIPEGDRSLEHKLEGTAYGFLIPVFFAVSGAKIDLSAVFAQPALLVGFIVLLLIIRAAPIFVALSTAKGTRDISTHNRLTVALYCTTALPIIVAVTSVAVGADAMLQETASVLVAAGAITVFLMPLLGMLTYRVADAKPIEAVREIAHNPRDIGDILREHWELERMLAREEELERRLRKGAGCDHPDAEGGVGGSSWQDRAALLQRRGARRRAIDEALDLAAQEMARHDLAVDADPDGDGPRHAVGSPSLDERRRRIARLVAHEHRRRLIERGRLIEQALLVQRDEDARDGEKTDERD
ncbi:sodium:proton exchanger [Gordonibacter sp. An230]|uniref:cation:proton antiporter n=1 Tax=Gordonibacter sp. An230 TaxID=1965592 RepID=UPI000B37AFF6|nr:cation:proton antiporter [Gordonibacter sp. An230]OUO87770.1 sodium:proton exchanger [Gordonibacter sp. An230]